MFTTVFTEKAGISLTTAALRGGFEVLVKAFQVCVIWILCRATAQATPANSKVSKELASRNFKDEHDRYDFHLVVEGRRGLILKPLV